MAGRLVRSEERKTTYFDYKDYSYSITISDFRVSSRVFHKYKEVKKLFRSKKVVRGSAVDNTFKYFEFNEEGIVQAHKYCKDYIDTRINLQNFVDSDSAKVISTLSG